MGSRRDWAAVTASTRARRTAASRSTCPGTAHRRPGDGARRGRRARAALDPGRAASPRSPRILAAAGGGSVVGYSLGGRLALQLAVEHPDLVARAVIISASPGIADEAARRARRSRGRAPRPPAGDAGARAVPRRLVPPAAVRRRCGSTRASRRSSSDGAATTRACSPARCGAMGTGAQRSLWGDLAGPADAPALSRRRARPEVHRPSPSTPSRSAARRGRGPARQGPRAGRGGPGGGGEGDGGVSRRSLPAHAPAARGDPPC